LPELLLSNISFPQEAPVGQNKRPIPAKLGKKLKAIRDNLGLTGEQLIEKLDCASIKLDRSGISKYEKGLREPPLIVILQYARLARVPMEALVDDAIDLTLK
jgi:transcriptional regulator with XRE-family HTH domain